MQKNAPIIIIAAVVGIAALGLTFMTLFRGSNPAAPAPEASPKATQYVALRDVPPRTALQPAMFTAEEVEASKLAPGAVTNLDELTGTISAAPIYKGQPLTLDKTTKRVARVIPANIPIPLGLRAVAIWIDPMQTAAGLVDVGDRVDVLVTHKVGLTARGTTERLAGNGTVTSGRTIVQDVEVLGVDKSITAAAAPAPAAGAPGAVPPPAPSGGQPATPAAAPAPAPNPNQPQRTRLILAVRPEDAQRLVAANDEGKLHITIRNPSSTERFATGEAREYPSRIYFVPDTEKAERLAKERREEARRAASERLAAASLRSIGGLARAPQTPPMPVPAIPGGEALPGVPGALGAAPAPVQKEVTVIRGTEKTRVLVPN